MIREKFPVSGTFQSPILTTACGVEVTITFSGSYTVLTFPDRPVGPHDLTAGNVVWVATAGTNEVRFQNVSMEVERVEPDGTIISSIAGHRPVEVTGVVKTNVDTGETIMETPKINDIRRLCELLTR
jgi:hypothetical protein